MNTFISTLYGVFQVYLKIGMLFGDMKEAREKNWKQIGQK